LGRILEGIRGIGNGRKRRAVVAGHYAILHGGILEDKQNQIHP
jgi:hypothetical protein